MTINEKVKQYLELRAKKEEIENQIDEIEGQIKAEMTEDIIIENLKVSKVVKRTPRLKEGVDKQIIIAQYPNALDIRIVPKKLYDESGDKFCEMVETSEIRRTSLEPKKSMLG